MYAVLKTGGKQYKVAEQQVITIEKTEGEVGKVIKFDQILAIGNEKGVDIGEPTIKGATVSAEILEQKKDDKIIIFKKKRRQNYRRKNGHRQQITVVRILDVSGKGEAKKTKTKKTTTEDKVSTKTESPKKEVAATKPATTKKVVAKKDTSTTSTAKKATTKKDAAAPKKSTDTKKD